MKIKYLIGGVAALLLSPAITFASFNANLSYGMSNSDVYSLQELLVTENCFAHEPNGYFGLLTLQGVKCFQTQNGISPTGYFGSISRTQANIIIVSATASSTDESAIEATTTVSVPPQIYQGADHNWYYMNTYDQYGHAIPAPAPILPAGIVPPSADNSVCTDAKIALNAYESTTFNKANQILSNPSVASGVAQGQYQAVVNKENLLRSNVNDACRLSLPSVNTQSSFSA